MIVSRGELLEIGGGFRIPEMMAGSGAHLVEVGTTNRTRRDDYVKAVTNQTALLLKVHTSNYRIVGFTESVSVAEVAQLGRLWDRDLPSVIDLGSGLLDETCPWLPGRAAGVARVRTRRPASSGERRLPGDLQR